MSIEKYNLKWLEYMNGLDLTKVNSSLCPNGHLLVAYPTYMPKNDALVITCPQGDCDYYDYNTFQVAKDIKISVRIRKLR